MDPEDRHILKIAVQCFQSLIYMMFVLTLLVLFLERCIRKQTHVPVLYMMFVWFLLASFLEWCKPTHVSVERPTHMSLGIVYDLLRRFPRWCNRSRADAILWLHVFWSFVYDLLLRFLEWCKRKKTDAIPGPHVLLSFAYDDSTWRSFASILRGHLGEAGIYTFWNNDFDSGEEIGHYYRKYIKGCKILMPILSRNYAFSVKCLTELAYMVECHRTEEQRIIPIFYGVKPSEVRHQRGIYEEAFRQHMDYFDERTVQQWRDALKKVGEMSRGGFFEDTSRGGFFEETSRGEIFEETSRGGLDGEETNGPDLELVKNVAEKVLLELKNNYINVRQNLVGMDHHVAKVEELLNANFNGVPVVGICGMGGLGKTTIAQVIYEKLCQSFEYCCFLGDIRLKSKDYNGLVNLQSQLIFKTRKVKSGKILDVGEGIEKVKDAVYGKKVLIVLDDVDEKRQFDMLAGKCNWYGVGSKIIVTTRNKEVLKMLESMYEKNGLLEVCRSYKPPLMNPDLSLQVFSMHAFFSDVPLKDYKILSKKVVSSAGGLPLVLVTTGSLLAGEKDKIQWEEKLMKLDKLPHMEVFEKLRISYEALEYKQQQIFLDIACLFIGEDRIYPSYMWDECGFDPRNGISTLVRRSMVKVEDDNRLSMHDLLRDLGRQIVREENSSEPWDRSRLWSREEAYDLLIGCKGTENVEALHLDFIRGERESRPNRLVGKDFENLHNLRFLRVGSVDLDGDFEHLFTNLIWLKWSPLGNFSPFNFHLENLVILDLSYSQIADDWKGWSQIRRAKKLKVLNLSQCFSLTTTTHFSMLVTLEQLILSSCFGLVEVDPLFGNLINLRTLDLSNCLVLRGSLNCYKFAELESLDVSSTRLRELCGLGELKSLKYLNTSGCRSLVSLFDLSNMDMLRILNTSGCVKLVEIQGLDKLEYLECLDISGCISMERLPDISIFGMVEEVIVAKCDKLVEVDSLRDVQSLNILDISWCASLKCVPNFQKFEHLKKLKIGGFRDLNEILGLEEVKFLELLDISGWKSIESLPEMSNLKKLKEIYACRCVKLIEIRGLEQLWSLEMLDISGCNSIKKLPDLSNLKRLKIIKASGCSKLSEIRGLEELKSLALLDISGCKSLGNRPYLPSTRIEDFY